MRKLFVFSSLLWLAIAPAFGEDNTARRFMFDQFDQEAWHDPFFLQRDEEAKKEREARERKLKEANQEREDEKQDKQNKAGYQPEDFGPEDFRDLDIGKDIFEKFYMDVKNLEHKEVVKADDEPFDRRYPEIGIDDKKRDDKSDFLPIRADLGQRPGIIQDLPGDWVPDKLDPIDNGGFAVSPDNGSPVPYRLNGHVDLQRVLPWDINN